MTERGPALAPMARAAGSTGPGGKPRVAIACPGIGLSQRGVERMLDDLFRLMRDDVEVTLFKGGGAQSEREKVPLFLPRNGRFVRLLPIHGLLGRTPIHVECLTFALALLPYLRGDRFDVVHCIDPPLARMLFKLRRLLGMRFRLLYTHGVSMPPSDYPPADHAQQVSEVTYHEAIEAGVRAGSMTLLPCGIHPERFEPGKDRAALRREYDVAPGTFVILSVAALNRGHKRVHHLIAEAARLQGEFILWLDASMDQGEPDLIEHAKARLGDRFRITHVPSDKVGDLYRIADVMAHAATAESFGLSIIEAAASGLPVITHDAPHFRWLVPNAHSWVDMTAPGALARRLALLMEHRDALRDLECREIVRRRFAWPSLRLQYRALYERAAALEPSGSGRRRVNYFWQLHG